MVSPAEYNGEKDRSNSVLNDPKAVKDSESLDDIDGQSIELSPKEYKRLLWKIDKSIVPYVSL
jgi:hypothetical protein